MRVYLDNCCYNRPYDPQGDLRIVLETLAKLQVQHLMRTGVVEYVWSDILVHEVSRNPYLWSDILVHEVSRNPYLDRREAILEWMDHASDYIVVTSDVVDLRIANPVEFMVQGGEDDDCHG